MRRLARSLVGPLIGGVGAWCAAGVVSLPSATVGAARVVVPAHLWVGLLAVTAATLIPGWRRRPSTATPALLAVLPWLPLKVPGAVLLWTGYLAWLPVGLAVIAGLADRSVRRASAASVSHVRPARNAIAAGLCTLVVSIVVAWAVAPRLPGGDEPHYLIITQSLLKDGDLAIENNHRARDYAAYFEGTIDPAFIQRGRGDVIYSIHAPGLPALVLPLFALFGYRGAQATVILLAALTGALVWYAGWLATKDRVSAWFAWAAVAGSATFLIQSVTIFPDGPGAAIVALAVVLLLRLERGTAVSTGALVATSAGLAVLPFLHTRFVTLSIGFGLAVVWTLLADSARPWGARRPRVIVFLSVAAVGAVAWFSYFQILYGTPNPAVAYGRDPETRLAYVPGGVLGLLLDQQFGLLAFAPVLIMAVWGWLARTSRAGSLAGRRALPAVALYLAAVGTYWMWWAGMPAPPARFAAAILPALAAPIAVAWRQASLTTRVAWASLLGITLSISLVIIVVDHGVLVWNTYDAHAAWLNWLEAVVDLPRAWPSFFWRLTPGIVSTEGPFAVHAALWGVVVALVAVVLRIIGRRSAAPNAAGASWSVALGIMVAAQIGWSSAHVPPSEPVGSQLRVLRSAAAGAAVFDLEPGRWPRRHLSAPTMRIEVPRVDLPGNHAAQWATLDGLPAGDYDLRVVERRLSGGVLTVRVGRGAPLLGLALDRQPDQQVRVSLPAGADALVFEPDLLLAAAGRSLTLTPVALDPPVSRLTTASWSTSDFDVFFVGGGMFLEPDGFWVRGSDAVDFTVASRRDDRAALLDVSNGGVSNTVVITGAPGRQTLRLAPGESRRVPLPLDDRGLAHVTLASETGFRPSDSPPSDDHRFLGVRVRVGRDKN